MIEEIQPCFEKDLLRRAQQAAPCLDQLLYVRENSFCPKVMVSNTRIFISYSSADVDIAEQFESELKAAGFDVWRDKTRLETDWSREIAEALARSDVLCLIWTNESAKSKWVKHEWLTASALEKSIIPCIPSEAPDLPQRLFNIDAIKASDPDDAVEQLRARVANMSTFSQKYDYTTRPNNTFIPYNPNPSFTGRDQDLLDLYLNMIGNLNKTGLNQVGLAGMGGAGKTQLAIEFVYRFSFAFEGGIYWFQAADRARWLEEFISIAKRSLPNRNDQGLLRTNEEWLRSLQEYFKHNPPTLVVMDNVLEPSLLHDEQIFQVEAGLAPLTLGCDILFTTLRHFDLPRVIEQNVDILSEEAAFTLLTSRRKPIGPNQEEVAKRICEVVGRLPLALVLIEGYLSNYSSVSFADYYSELLHRGLPVIDESEMNPASLATRHKTSISVTLEIQLRMLKDRDAKRLFKLASLFPQASLIPSARLALLSGIPATAAHIGRPLEKAINTLAQLSLVKKSSDAESITLHPLVSAFGKSLFGKSVKWLPLGIGAFLKAKAEQTFKAKAAKNLDVGYADPVRLFNEYSVRGINEVVADFDIAIEWVNSNEVLATRLKPRRKLLDRERHHLKPGLPQERRGPVSFLQQLHYRAFVMGLDELSDHYYRAKLSKGGIVLKVVSISQREDPSWMRTLRGHLAKVGSVSLSSNGKRALSSDFDGRLILWDVATADPIRTFRSRTDDDYPKVSLNGDGSVALVSTQDQHLALLDVNTGSMLKTVEPKLGDIVALSLSPDCQQALSAHEKDTLALWDMNTGELLRSFNGLPNVRALARCLDGWYAISQTQINTHTLWRVDGGEIVSVFTGDQEWSLGGASLSENGDRAVSGSAFDYLTLWNPRNGGEISATRGHPSWVGSVSLSRDGKLAVSAAGETLNLWNVDVTKSRSEVTGHMLRVDALSVTGDGKWALSGSDDKTLILWDVTTGKLLRRFKGFPSMLVSIDSSCERVLSGSIISGDLVLWDLETETTIHRFNIESSQLSDIQLSDDGKTALAYTTMRRLMLWDAESGERLLNMQQNQWVWAAGFSSDNHYAALACHNEPREPGKPPELSNILEIWDLRNEARVCTFTLPCQSISGVCFLEKRRHVVVTTNSNQIFILDWETGQIVRSFYGLGQWTSTRGLSAHGGYLLTMSNPDNLVLVESDVQGRFLGKRFVPPSIILWDLINGKALVQLLLPNPATSISIFGNRVIFGDKAGIVCFLKVMDGK